MNTFKIGDKVVNLKTPIDVAKVKIVDLIYTDPKTQQIWIGVEGLSGLIHNKILRLATNEEIKLGYRIDNS